jgi:hypothetical protein
MGRNLLLGFLHRAQNNIGRFASAGELEQRENDFCNIGRLDEALWWVWPLLLRKEKVAITFTSVLFRVVDRRLRSTVSGCAPFNSVGMELRHKVGEPSGIKIAQ